MKQPYNTMIYNTALYMLAIFLLLISAAALFIADLAAKKKHIVSEKKPEHSGSRGHA